VQLLDHAQAPDDDRHLLRNGYDHEPVGYEVVHVRRVPAGRFVDAPVPDRYVNGRLTLNFSATIGTTRGAARLAP